MARELKIGDKATITRRFTDADVRQFAELSTDHNPIHLDPDYAAGTQFKQRIVHGALVGSLFSALLGEHLPGHGGIYMGQTLQFKAPVFLDMEVIASVEITAIHERKPIVTLSTQCVDAEGKTLITGEAVMYVPWLKDTAST
ncbi:MaoC family dehydratase [Thiorhodococcus fuscus]|uniref:MaoC family dehydratase n=1 Tax=Thiorhodococcus fuscus TaxID=527200 RepID=A0ABW4Y5R4_9GAMM